MRRVSLSSYRIGAKILGLVALCAVSTGTARGASLAFDNTANNDTVTVGAANFEFGFTGAGTFPEAGPVNFSGSWQTGIAQATDSQTIYFTRPDQGGQVGVILEFTAMQVQGLKAAISGSFWASDTGFDASFLAAHPATQTQVALSAQTVALQWSEQNLGIRLASTDPVPEPASIGLLSLATVPLLARRQRNNSHPA